MIKTKTPNLMKNHLSLALILTFGFAAFAQKARYESRTALSDSVNVVEDESAALLSPDGKTLYFVRSFYKDNVGGTAGNQDIYFSTRLADGLWTKALNMGAPLNDEFHNAVCGISRDGKKVYLNNIKVRQDKVLPGISVSTLTNEGWSRPVAISDYDFPEKGFFQVFVSPDEDVAIVSFEGPGTEGIEDLYFMKKNAAGKFSNPVSLGDKVNSSGFETSPILSKDSKTLYFSSNGFGGQGDGDIYKSTRLDDTWTNWSAPENLGPRINTSGFDGSFNLDEEGNAYYISGEGASGPGNVYVISMIPPPPPPPPAVVEKEPEPPVVQAPPPPKPTSVEVFGQALFAFNSIVINPESKESLNWVAKKLKANKLYRIQVEGHTDDVGAEMYNQRLSERRAMSVKKYLIKKGIPASKIKTQGFGELNPIADNTSEEGRSKNRRVEVKYFLP